MEKLSLSDASSMLGDDDSPIQPTSRKSPTSPLKKLKKTSPLKKNVGHVFEE